MDRVLGIMKQALSKLNKPAARNGIEETIRKSVKRDKEKLYSAVNELSQLGKSTSFNLSEDLVQAIARHNDQKPFQNSDVALDLPYKQQEVVSKADSKEAKLLAILNKMTGPQCCVLGQIYYFGESGVKLNKERAAVIWKKGMELKDETSTYNYAGCLRQGVGVAKDQRAAFQIYETLASRGHPGGKVNYALSLLHGTGTGKNIPKAKELLEVAATANMPAAMYMLGCMANDGVLTKDGLPDYEEAALWWRRGSKLLKDPSCTTALAVYVSEGKGIAGGEPDEQEAFRLHMLAASKGMAQAQYNVGCHYMAGSGVEKSLELAVEYWEKAANTGYKPAMLNLCKMYFEGKGVRKNNARILALYAAATDATSDELASFENMLKKADKDPEAVNLLLKDFQARFSSECKGGTTNEEP